MRRFTTRRRALPAAQFEALRRALLGSPLVGATTLNGPFRSSRGFAVTFTDAGRAEVEARFPEVAPWLERTLGTPARRSLTPWFERVGPPANAWYLNVLLVSAGGTVGRHVDATLREKTGVDDALPLLVSVLYLQVPRAKGGTLKLWVGDELVGEVAPRENSTVNFRGDLAHEVVAFEGEAGALRASLVIEQYRFGAEVLAQLPPFHLDSRAGFGAYLAHHADAQRLKAGKPPGSG